MFGAGQRLFSTLGLTRALTIMDSSLIGKECHRGICRPKQLILIKLCFALLISMGWFSVQGATLTWNGSVSTDWFNKTNWTPAAVPGSGDTVNFSSGTISPSAPVTFNGQFNWSGGSLSGNGLTIGSSGVLNIEGSVTLYDALTNYGTVNWQAGTVTVYNLAPNGYTGAIWNQAGAVWNIQCDQSINTPYGGGAFSNAGQVVKTAGTNSTTFNDSFVNTASLIVQSGTINFNGGVISMGGSFQTAANTSIYGNISGAFSGTLNWSGGQINSGAPLTVATNGVLNIQGSVSLFDALTNYGTVNWQAGTLVVYNLAPNDYIGAIWNQAGAVWNIQCDQTINSPYGGGAFSNAGQVVKSAGTNTTTFNDSFVSTGIAVAQSGTIQFSGGGSLSGSLQAAADAAIYINGGTFVVNSGLNFEGPGTVQVTGGNFSGTLSGTLNWSGGQLTSGASLTIANNGVLNLEGGVSLFGALTNYGTVNWQAGTVTVYNLAPNGYTGAIWNQAGAVWNIQCDQTINTPYGGGAFSNAGQVVKTAGTNSTTFNDSFVNSGSLIVQSGTINFSGGAIGMGGSFQNAANAITGNLSGTFSGTLDWSGGTLNSGQSLIILTNGVLNIEGSVVLEGALTNYGTVNWQAGDIYVYNNNGAPYTGAIWNQPGGVWNIQCDQTIHDWEGYEQFYNAGLLLKNAGTNSTTIQVVLNNSGTVDAQSGTIQFSEGGSLGGTFQAESGAAINFNGGYWTVVAGITSQGPGSVLITGGYVSGTLSGTLNLSGGLIYGAPLTVATDGILNIEGSVGIYCALTNNGTVNWQAGDIYVYNNNGAPYTGAIWNQPGGVWNIQCDQTMHDWEGYEQFYNAGLLLKNAGTNSTSIQVVFSNSGTVTALEGTIAYNNGMTLTNGTLNFGLGGPANFGQITISGAVNLTGSVGAVLLDGYVPSVGAQFNVLSFGSATGAITDYSGLNVGSGIALNSLISSTAMTLQAAATNFVAVTPAIISQPLSQTVNYGGTVTFNALVSGSTPLAFQWNQNGAPIAGGTNVSLTLSNLLVSQSGSYTLAVTNPVGGAISQPAILNVLKLVPVLTWSNPSGISYGTAIGSSQLNAGANVPGTFVYTPPSGTILNAGTSTLSVTFTPTDAVDYASVAGSVSITVSQVPLSAIANNASRAYGQTNPVFNGTITGLINGDNITESYNCSATPTSQPGTYPIVPVLVDPNGRLGNYSVTINNGTLTVDAGPPPTLAGISPNLGPTTGGTVVMIIGNGFETGATVGFGSLPASSVNVTATNSLTAVTPVSPAGLVNVTVTNADGNVVTLTNVFTYGVPPGIQDEPYNQSVLPGRNVQFQVQVAGASPLVYQWQFNGVNLLDFGGISGSHTATLTISNVSLSQAGNYSVIITNAFGTVTSSAATLTILVPPSITTQPQALAEGVGANVNFSVTATGTQPLSYQWYQNGGPLSGATASVLNIPSIQSGNQGNYTVVVTNIAGTVTSASAALNVLGYCASAQASQTNYPAGTTVPLSVKTFACGSSVAVPNSAAVVWLYEAGSTRSFPVVTDGSGNSTFNFVPFPGEVGLCQFAAALPGQSAPAAQGSFTLVGMSLSAQSANPQLIVGIPQTNTVTLSNLTSLELSGITTTVLGQPGNVNVQVTAPATLAGNATAQAGIVMQATDTTTSQAQFTIQFTSAEGTTNNFTVNASMTALAPQLVATPSSLNGVMVVGGQTLVSFSLANVGGAASGPVQVLLPSTPWLSLVTPASIPSLAPGASNVVTLALTAATNLALGPYTGAMELIGSGTQLQVPFNFTCVSSQIGALQVTVQDELSIYGSGNPNLSNATVTVTDFLTGTNVASAVTDNSGIVLFPNLTVAYYNLEVSAPDHDGFSATLLLAGNQTSDLTAFLPLQLVDYTFTVTPTNILDNYDITLQTTLITSVPWPVLTITPGLINLCSLSGSSNQINLVITNNGLIAAQGLQIVVGTNANWLLQPLASDLGDLAAESGIVVPMMISQLGSSSSAASSIAAQVNWHVATPTQTNYYSTPIFVYNANPANCAITSIPAPPPPPVVVPPPDSGGSVYVGDGEGGGGGDGGGGGGGGPIVVSGPARGSSPQKPYSSSPNIGPTPPVTGAIVSVRVQIDQTAIISRDAFHATLKLDNNSGSLITGLKVTIIPQDALGNPAMNFFGISPPTLSGLNAVDGSGSMGIGASGSASWTIVPTTNAAPTVPVQYAIGGTLSYLLNGQQVTIPFLPPTSITVWPCPILNVDYFLQHDVYSDDPFTPQIEPSIPVALGLLVKNNGQGNAYGFTITSSQPQIITNANDLAVAFQLISSQVGTKPPSPSPSLTLDLGDIKPQGSAEGIWYLTSTLEGEFIDFSATYRHMDDFGNPNTSLINSVRTHEMNHTVRITTPSDDGLTDFLVNDTTNVDALPDVVYSSDGSTSPVASVTSGVTVGTPSNTNSTMTLTASAPSGYVYLEVVDPGAGNYPITSVRRSDGVNLLVGTNVWQTPARIHMLPSKPNNLIHIFDYNSTGSYTVTYGLSVTLPTATTLAAVNITSTNATLNATINPDGAITEYYFQWGATTNYGNPTPSAALTQSLYALQAVESGVSLPPGTTNHFQIVAVNSAGTSYGGDVTFVTPALPPPVITQVTNRFSIVGQNISFTNHAIAATPPITYSLDASAPAGASITTNGIFKWVPVCDQGSTTNQITIWATDSGTPPLSNSMTFTVTVSECVQVGIGSTVMQAGQTSGIPVTLLSTVGITNLTFTLSSPTNRFANWTFTSSNASIASATVQAVGSSPPTFALGTLPSQTLQSPSLLGTIGFTALPGNSAFVPVSATNVIGIKSDGSGVGNIASLSGRITVIGSQPLLEALLNTGQPRALTIYGNPGANYQMVFSTDLTTANWQSAGSVLMTNLQQNFNVNQSAPQIYYRAQ